MNVCGYRSAVVLGAISVLASGCGEGSPASSKDRGIVFSSDRDGDFEIYVMDGEGQNVRRLTQNAGTGANEADDHSPSWAPDGRRFAFTSTRDHEGDGFDSNELYVMGSDGGGQTRLTENETGEGPPSWSPDGEELLYARRRVPGKDPFELALLRADGTGDRPVVEIDGYGSGVFSPDGTRIAFTECAPEGDELDCEIWVAAADGSDRRLLVDSPGRDSGPAWSPDGSKIAFASDRDRNGECFFHDCWGHNGEIYVMNADGSEQTRITHDPGDDSGPTWSPDGSRIAFAGLRDVDGAVDAPEENYEIYVVDADGSDLRQLTDNTAWDVEPDWS